MSKYTLVRYETTRRTEKVEYIIEIPEQIKRKQEYADEEVFKNNYLSFKVAEIIESERLDEEPISIHKTQD